MAADGDRGRHLDVRLSWPQKAGVERSDDPHSAGWRIFAPGEDRAGDGDAIPGTVMPVGRDSSRAARYAADPRIEELVDADLASVLSELASLRASVGDVAERVQLRQLRASIEDLRSELAPERSPVPEWSDVATQVLDALDELRQEVGALRAQREERAKLGSLGPLVAEVAALREEVRLLRRRLPLRAATGRSVTKAEVELLIEGAVERILEGSRRRR